MALQFSIAARTSISLTMSRACPLRALLACHPPSNERSMDRLNNHFSDSAFLQNVEKPSSGDGLPCFIEGNTDVMALSKEFALQVASLVRATNARNGFTSIPIE